MSKSNWIKSPWVDSCFRHYSKLSSIIFYQWTDFMDYTGRKRIILDRETDEPYIERYYLF